MRLGEILSELREQRRRIDRAIAALEMLKRQPRKGKRKTNRKKSKYVTQGSRQVYPRSTKTETLATEQVGRARVIPFGRLRRRA
jgi:hypothetical protein